MPLQWRVASFERGRTDNYVNGARNAGQKFENLIINRNRKIESRPGSEIFDDTSIATQRLPPGNQRIQHNKQHEGVLFEFTGDEIYYRDGSSFPELVGPVDGHDAFGDIGSPSTSRNASTQWQAHLIASIDTYSRPRKIYKDENNVWQIRTIGLPSLADVRGLSTGIALANSFKATYNAHVNDTSGGGSGHLVADINVTAPDATDVSSFVTLVNQLKNLYLAHNTDANLGTPTIHQGTSTFPPGNDLVGSQADAVTLAGAIDLINRLLPAYNNHDNDSGSHTIPSSHQESGSPAQRDFTLTSETPGATSYIYGLNYKYQYETNGKTYINRGPIHEVVITNGNDFTTSTRGIDISDIPELLNTSFGTKESWDTASIVIEINRTEANGIILKRVGEIANGVTTFEDDNPDNSLGINAYTVGGAVNNDPAPECKFLTQVNDVVWYANVKEGADENPYRVRQSIQSAPDAAPESFFTDIDEEITGIGSVNIFPIVFSENKTYRLENLVDAQGRGFVRKRIIDETVGCVSHNGIVKVKDGLYFPSKDGFYFTDGFKTRKVTNHLNTSYQELVANEGNRKRIYGKNNPEKDLVYWAVTSDASAVENDEIWVLDPHWGFPNGEGTFTSFAYGSNGAPTAIDVIDGDLVRSDSRGYTFRHRDTLFEDSVIDTTNNPEDWQTKAVIYDYVSSAVTFGTEFGMKWVSRLITVLKSLTNTSLQPQSINNDSGARRDLKEIRLRSVFEWGDPFFTWGDPEFVWNAPATSTKIRRFPKNGLRCVFKQVAYTNSFTILANSDTFGDATVDATAKTITLASGEWPEDLIGFEFFIGSNAEGNTITAQTATVLTVADPDNQLVDGVISDYVIKGFRRGEKFSLEGYTIVYDFFGRSHTAYNVGDDGGNAA